MIRQIKMPVEQLVASMIDLKSKPVHSTPKLAFRLLYIYEPTKTTFNAVY